MDSSVPCELSCGTTENETETIESGTQTERLSSSMNIQCSLSQESRLMRKYLNVKAKNFSIWIIRWRNRFKSLTLRWYKKRKKFSWRCIETNGVISIRKLGYAIRNLVSFSKLDLNDWREKNWWIKIIKNWWNVEN